MKKRPLGLKIIGVYCILTGAVSFLMGLALPGIHSWVESIPVEQRVDLGPPHRQQGAENEALLDSPQYQWLLRAATAIALFTLVVGVGVLMLQRWAYWLMLVDVAISVFWSLGEVSVRTSLFGGLQWFRLVPSLSWFGLILWYFLRPTVKAQFQK